MLTFAAEVLLLRGDGQEELNLCASLPSSSAVVGCLPCHDMSSLEETSSKNAVAGAHTNNNSHHFLILHTRSKVCPEAFAVFADRWPEPQQTQPFFQVLGIRKNNRVGRHFK